MLLVLNPLFSGLPEYIFHTDPHAGNLMVQTHKHAPLTLVLLEWSQAGRLSAPLRHALITLRLFCVTSDEPSPEVLTGYSRAIGSPSEFRCLRALTIHLHAAFAIVRQLALRGHPVHSTSSSSCANPS